MGLFDFLFEEEKPTAEEQLKLISQRASALHAKKKGHKTRKVWQKSLQEAKKELQKEGKI
ncbi:MAG: hypothetical protein GY810_31730 [Aureispira sp.]|nr:hypothetical protein [Aureispira sp.]